MRSSKSERLRGLIRPRRPAPREIVCLNCGASVTGSFCSVCGQATDTARYTAKTFFGEVYRQFRKLDVAEILLTFWELTERPGKFVREYLDGKRVGYLGPIKYFFYAFLLQFGVGYLIRIATGREYSFFTVGNDLTSQIVELLATIFWGVFWWLFYRRSSMNVTENIVAALYFTAQAFMFTLILRIVCLPLMSLSPHSETMMAFADIFLYLAYSFFFAHRLFREPAWKMVIKQSLLVVIYTIIIFTLVFAERITERSVKSLDAAPQTSEANSNSGDQPPSR